jgi:hypothetical protein
MSSARSAAVDGAPAARPAGVRSRETRPQKAADQSGGASPPTWRRLEIFAIDPSADTSIANVAISRCVLPVRWEPLAPGPIGEYIEVIDVDPSSNSVYDPVDLDDKHLVAQNGLTPSEGSPQFHQQMVYAVAMKTIENFERALGRRIIWSERLYDESGKVIDFKKDSDRYVRRLRIYPHALREANAYYSPPKKSLLFGYFNAATTDPRDELPGGTVFAALSHDIIAHEITHAILDGMHRRLLDPTNQDMLAFHEGFADIVAIFQHFTLPGLLLDQMQRTRGNLNRVDSFLSTLAVQFGRATMRGGALRNALGKFDPDGERIKADPSELARTIEPHDRGAILVAAVFEAFLLIYESRVRDLRRIATGGTGVLPTGDIHPDLARRFADEAERAAQQVLTICIRAVDYLPPADVTFGDYLRALITADTVVNPDDPRRDRVAFIEAFRNHGIYPLDVRSLGEDSLRWIRLPEEEWRAIKEYFPPPAVLRTMSNAWEVAEGDADFPPDSDGPKVGSSADGKSRSPDDQLGALVETFLRRFWKAELNRSDDAEADEDDRTQAGAGGVPAPKDFRRSTYLLIKSFSKSLYQWLEVLARSYCEEPRFLRRLSETLGLDFLAFHKYLTTPPKERLGRSGAIEVHTIRPTYRVQSNGTTSVELLVVLTQWRWELLRDEDGEVEADGQRPLVLSPSGEAVKFKYRGGTTLIIDPRVGRVTYAITKTLGDPEMASNARRSRVRRFLRDQITSLGDAAFDRFSISADDDLYVETRERRAAEPLALLHRDTPSGDW